MTSLIFMSPEHVERMNELLADAVAVRSACAELDRDYEIAYELRGGPGGTVHWVLRFERDSGASFALTDSRAADVTYLGDWADTMRRSRAMRDGEPVQPDLEVRGDVEVLERVESAYRAAHAAATVPIEFPHG